jgi:hypothetical protein
MALEEITVDKQRALRERIISMSNEGKSVRKIARMALKGFNVKLTLPNK